MIMCASDSRKRPLSYVNYLTILFFFAYGIKTLDAQCVTYFSEELIGTLGFSTSQYSMLSSLYWLSYGISAVLVGVVAAKSDKRKIWLAPSMIFAGVVSVWAGFSNSYLQLALSRLVSGACLGSCQAMMLAIILNNLVSDDYSSRSGIVNCGGAIIGSSVGPVIIAQTVGTYSWRSAFFLSGALLLICGVLIQVSVREIHQIKQTENRQSSPFSFIGELMQNRNYLLCLLIGVFETTAKIGVSVFAPIYYSDIMLMDAQQKNWYLALMGMTYIPASLLIPILADRFSLKKVMFGAFVLSMLAPTSAFLFAGMKFSAWLLAIFGAWPAATVPLYMYVMIQRTLPVHLHAMANGSIMGVSVLAGGCLAPIALSRLIDVGLSPTVVMAICSFALLLCIVMTLLLRENEKTAFVYKEQQALYNNEEAKGV